MNKALKSVGRRILRFKKLENSTTTILKKVEYRLDFKSFLTKLSAKALSNRRSFSTLQRD